MAFVTPKPYISYKHIEAKSPNDLELLMLAISVKSQSPPSFSAPTFSNGKWHTWFLYDWSKDIKPFDRFEMVKQ
jgi:hypothetical protein